MASATTKQLAQVPIVSREKRPDPSNNAAARGPCPHPHNPHRPVTPKTHAGQETLKMLSLRRGRDGVGRMADSGQPTKMCAHGARGLTLARNSPCPLASAHAPEAGLPRGYGSLHIAYRSIWKHDDRLGEQACCKQHALPTRLWDEAPGVSRTTLFGTI